MELSREGGGIVTAPCPVCGSRAYFRLSEIRPWEGGRVVCSVCGTFGPLRPTQQEAEEAWENMPL